MKYGFEYQSLIFKQVPTIEFLVPIKLIIISKSICMIYVKIDCNCNLKNKGHYLEYNEIGYLSNLKIDIKKNTYYISYHSNY